MLKPLGTYILAKVDDKSTITQLSSGLYMQKNAAEELAKHTVFSIGVDVKKVKPGQVVFLKPYSDLQIKDGADKYVIFQEDDVLAISE